MKVYEQNIEQTKQLLKDIKAKQGEGLALKNDITRYELLLSDLEFTVVQIRNTLGILNRREKVVENSPELRLLELAVKMNERQDKIVKSERLPQIALVAGNHFDGPITIEVPPIDKNFNYWYVGVGVKYNLASLYKTNKSVSRSKLTIRRTKEHYDDVCEQTELAVQAAYTRYVEAYEQLDTRRKNVELAGQNYAVIQNRYKNELSLITDMLDASNAKLSAEVQLANAQIDIAGPDGTLRCESTTNGIGYDRFGDQLKNDAVLDVLFNYYKLLYLTGTL